MTTPKPDQTPPAAPTPGEPSQGTPAPVPPEVWGGSQPGIDNSLPPVEGPVDPGYGRPDYAPARPSQGLPNAPVRPDQSLPLDPDLIARIFFETAMMWAKKH